MACNGWLMTEHEPDGNSHQWMDDDIDADDDDTDDDYVWLLREIALKIIILSPSPPPLNENM